MIRPGRRYGPVVHAPDSDFTFSDAVDGEGETIGQGIPIVNRPPDLPRHPVWPIAGPPTTGRIGRLSQPIGWDGTPNLIEA